ncbi:hypothetical protein L1887_34676 [Cichorium endivia]|nr:hypothetical protein L1887_34676 [Cichorium endivia]
MTRSISFVFGVIAVLMLLHAAYSTIQCNSLISLLACGFDCHMNSKISEDSSDLVNNASEAFAVPNSTCSLGAQVGSGLVKVSSNSLMVNVD